MAGSVDGAGGGQPAIRPIGAAQRRQVQRATDGWVQRAAGIYGTAFAPVPVFFDLRGRSAGMYRVQGGRRCIRYNPWLFGKYFDDSLAVTVPHEVAHYVTDVLWGLANVRPHGAEWQAVMRALGVEARATGQYDLEGIPVRRQRRHLYHCQCGEHELSSCRHNRVQRGEARYLCRQCGTAIVFAG